MFIARRSIYKKYLQMFSKKCSPFCGHLWGLSWPLCGQFLWASVWPPGQSLWPLWASVWPPGQSLGRSWSISAHFRASRSS